jgi:hypothetical protein
VERAGTSCRSVRKGKRLWRVGRSAENFNQTVEEGERLGYLEFVQILIPTTLTPLEYLERGAAKQVKRPENCANCGGAHCLEALGYYWRYISQLLAPRQRSSANPTQPEQFAGQQSTLPPDSTKIFRTTSSDAVLTTPDCAARPDRATLAPPCHSANESCWETVNPR